MFSKRNFIRIFPIWFPFAVATVLLCFLIYISIQHVLRTGANDPQIQLSDDAAFSLSMGKQPAGIFTTDKIDMSRSLSPYVIVYNDKGEIIESSVSLHGKDPVLPKGVFEDAKKGQLRFTWQPEQGVRQAVVVTHYSGIQKGFVLAGRSLREVEKREDELLFEIVIGSIVSLILVYLTVLKVSFSHRLRNF